MEEKAKDKAKRGSIRLPSFLSPKKTGNEEGSVKQTKQESKAESDIKSKPKKKVTNVKVEEDEQEKPTRKAAPKDTKMEESDEEKNVKTRKGEKDSNSEEVTEKLKSSTNKEFVILKHEDRTMKFYKDEFTQELLREHTFIPPDGKITFEDENGMLTKNLQSGCTYTVVIITPGATREVPKPSTTSEKIYASILKGASPSAVASSPSQLNQYIYCHRSFESEVLLHTTLVSSILAKIYDRINNLPGSESPSQADATAAFSLMKAMSALHHNELEMRLAFNNWGLKYLNWNYEQISVGSPLSQGKRAETDGSIIIVTDTVNVLVCNREDKFSGCNADLQNATYFAKYWAREKLEKKTKISLNTPCPSLLVTLEGTNLTVSAAVATDVGVLCDFYGSVSILPIVHDDIHMEKVARFVMVLRLGIQDLQNYYKNSFYEPSDGFPLYRNIESQQFTYERRIGASRTFIANMGNQKIIVKFCRSYSADAHNACPLAPRLLYCAQVTGRWYLVIMEYVDGQLLSKCKNNLQNSKLGTVARMINDAVAELHSKNFVHGDLRMTNIIIKMTTNNTDVEKVSIIDFDWSGQEGVARYPLYMNHEQIQWPPGATAGEIITKEHDKHMISQLVV